MACDNEHVEEIIKLGDKFRTFEELECRIHEYSKKKFVQFWRRDSRKIRTAKTRVATMTKKLSPELVYYEVKYCCIHGGRKFQARSKGSRNTSTFKQGCPAQISLRACKDGSALEVKSFNDDHNHNISAKLFNQLPQQRQLPQDLKKKAISLMEVKANKKLVQQKLREQSGKIILPKDLHNIASSVKKNRARNNLAAAVEKLKTDYGETVQILADGNGNLKVLYFQDKQMKDVFSSYPEIILVDLTYKLLELRLGFFLMLVEDSNGESELTAAGLFVTEDECSLKWFFETFKAINPNWRKIRMVMADKGIKERHIVKVLFPNVSLLICAYQTLHTFSREVTVSKLGLTSGQQSLSLDLLQKMVYAKSQDDYNSLYNQLKESVPDSVLHYYNTNWHPIREQWTMGMKFATGNFINSTNNFIEYIHSKLKAVPDQCSSLENFLNKFNATLKDIREEHEHRAANVVQKIPVVMSLANSPEAKYRSYLTPYAFKHVSLQLASTPNVEYIKRIEDDRYSISTSDGLQSVSPTSCTCCFQKSMLLPCRHMFAVRAHSMLDLYSERLCDVRWTRSYYTKRQRVFLSPTSEADCTTTTTMQLHKVRVLSSHEKLRKASVVTSTIASVVSESSGIHFEHKMEFLGKLLHYWKHGTEVGLLEIGDEEQNRSGNTYLQEGMHDGVESESESPDVRDTIVRGASYDGDADIPEDHIDTTLSMFTETVYGE